MKKFARTITVVRELLKHDVEAALDGDPSVHCTEEIILSFPFIEAIAIQRLAHRLYKEGAPIIPRMMTEWAHSRTGIDIHPGASIGTHFFIDHATGVVIGESCTIGNHVKIYQGVTLGAKSFEVDNDGHPIKGVKRHPDIEDHVTIYAHATILGGDTRIGAHSIIGGNVWLLQSVPPHSIVQQKGDNLLIRPRRKKEPTVVSHAQAAAATDWVI
jgi:serine O-acetyltransferase